MSGHQRRSFPLALKLKAVQYAEETSGSAAARHFRVDPKSIREWKCNNDDWGNETTG